MKDGENVNLIFATSNNIKNINMNDVLKGAMSLIQGKGGGNQVLHRAEERLVILILQ